MELKIQTSKTFLDLLNDDRIAILQGGTRSGKSYSAIQYLITKALENPNLSISIVRKSFPSLRISALRDFKTILKEWNLWEEDSWYASENTYTFDNESSIEFLSVQDSERRKGTKRNILFIDEANELNYEDYFQLSIRTTDKIIIAYNPSFPTNHWIFQQVLTHPEAQRYITTYRDNPFLDDTLVQEIERLEKTSPSYWKIYGLGLEGVVEGLIFDNVEVIDIIPDTAELQGYGIDFGYSNDPTALVALWKTEDGILFDEVCYMKNLLSNQISNFIRAAYNQWGKKEVIADSADPRLIEEIFRSGINIKPAMKGPDSILAGIDTMKQYKIYITKKSENMIDEFYSYTFKKNKNEEFLNEPIDTNNHAIDACRYISMFKLSNKRKNYGSYTISIR
jgi:phage terminase large subunit